MSTSEYIDVLFEQYLDLLDQHGKLRHELNALQSSVYHHISRANFSAERGIRYGQDFYDERMQASTSLKIATSSSDELYKFSAINAHTKQNSENIPKPENAQSDEILQRGLGELNIEETEDEKSLPSQAQDEGEDAEAKETEGEDNAGTESAGRDTEVKDNEGKDTQAKPIKTPLSWFGILTPGAQSLRSAQAASSTMVTTIIPKMASLDCEMKELEIRIRRARKFRAKAEAEFLKKEKVRPRNNLNPSEAYLLERSMSYE